MSQSNLVEKGSLCLDDRDDIPGAPLWHMGKIAAVDSQASFELMQNTIDYLTCKGKQGRPFSDSEKEFMKELFESFWWGGTYLGYHEAAKLAAHYVSGSGRTLRISPLLYKRSVIVSDTVEALKGYIRELAERGRNFRVVRTGDYEFLRSKHVNPLTRGTRNPYMQGELNVHKGGVLVAEQPNRRLHYADNQFFLVADTTAAGVEFVTRWQIESYYDYESFEGPNNFHTEIPLNPSKVLKLPDGLSNYLEKIGVARAFTYVAEWCERWK